MEIFPFYREIRGDGNCFFRAYIFRYIETLLKKKINIPPDK